jgi:tRNA modification GTPase
VPSPSERKTIYALSTPPGKGGIGIIRISGPDALDVYSTMVRVKTGRNMKGKEKEHHPEPWKMQRCSIVHPNNGQVLDEGMVVFFQGKLNVYFHCYINSLFYDLRGSLIHC